MSTYFSLSRKVNGQDLLGGRLAPFEIREHVSSNTSERSRCLTDGRNYLWVYLTEDGFVELPLKVWSQRAWQDPRRDQRSI